MTNVIQTGTEITVKDTGSSSASGQGSQSILSGTPTPGSVIVWTGFNIAAEIPSSFAMQIGGTWTGTLAFEMSMDAGVTYIPYDAQLVGIGTQLATITGNCVVKGNLGGVSHIRLRATDDMTGSVSAQLIAGNGSDVQHYIVQLGDVTIATVTVSNLPGTVSTNSGNAGASTLRAAVDGTGATGIAQDTGGVGTQGWLTSIVKNARLILTQLAFGQGLMAASLPVAIASDQSQIPVGQTRVNKRVTPTVTAGAYSAGQVMGGVQAIANAVRAGKLSAVLESLLVTSKSATTPALILYFFDTNPSNGTYTDNNALTWNAADFAFLIGTHVIAAADFAAEGSKETASYGNIIKDLVCTGTSLYMLAVATGSFTPASTSDYTISLNLRQD